MERKYDNWIDAFVEHTTFADSPKIFRKWAGIGAIASTLGRRVWMCTRGRKPIYPNLYILLVCSGGGGKTQAIDGARGLVEQVPGLNLAPKGITPARFVTLMSSEELQEQQTQLDKPSAITQTAISVILGEFSTFLSDEIRFWDILATLYDNENFDKEIVGTKTNRLHRDDIEKPCVNILGGVQMAWFTYNLPEAVFHRGFVGRFCFVYHEGVEPDLFSSAPDDPETEAALLHDLKDMARIDGEFTWDETMIPTVRAWQRETMPDYLKGDERFKSYYRRRGIHAAKLAMILSVSRSSKRRVTKEDWQGGMALVEEMEQDFDKSFTNHGGNPLLPAQRSMVAYVLRRFEEGGKPIREAELLRLSSDELRPMMLMEAIGGLVTTGQLKPIKDSRKRRLYVPPTCTEYDTDDDDD